MTTTDLAAWSTAHGEVHATPEMLREMFNAPTATDMEVHQFIQICRAQRLNPFLREAYLIKYSKDKPASFVTGKETFTQRAEAHLDYDGMEAGIIVLRGDQEARLKGAFHLPADTLLGGWATVYRKNLSRPIEKSVALAEYDTGQSLWKTKRATMIEKVASVQALREAFPSAFAGLYDSAEIGQDLPVLAPGDGEDAVASLPIARRASRAQQWQARLSDDTSPRVAAMGPTELQTIIDDMKLPAERVAAIIGMTAAAVESDLGAAVMAMDGPPTFLDIARRIVDTQAEEAN